MGKDVTTVFETYRECARHVRNTYFSSIESQDWDIVEDFNEVDRVLFQRLVLYRVTDAYDPALERAVQENRFLIVPSGDRMPLMVARDKTPGYWDHPIHCLEPGDAQIAFREYWDWDVHSTIDLRYYRGSIVTSAKHPDIIGHDVLIETIYGRVIFEWIQGG